MSKQFLVTAMVGCKMPSEPLTGIENMDGATWEATGTQGVWVASMLPFRELSKLGIITIPPCDIYLLQ